MITPVKYPLAKLLNDKEFKLEPYLKIDDQNPKNLNSNYNPREYQPWYLDLSLAEVVMWLYEKHGIWIDVRYMDDILNFGYTITTIKDNTEQYGLYKFNYPQQAYSAAIDYVLNNII